jgi:hypothetical protein
LLIRPHQSQATLRPLRLCVTEQKGYDVGRGDQLARQWRIIQTLVSSKHGRTVGDLVRDENCHPRTIYRDLEALQEAGFPIYQERRDGKGVCEDRGRSLVHRQNPKMM